ncbi:hypothetical protein [Maribellus mangrovi]|uniref:hypothetical protein n=1 Tax=Maribellus mangrovi TaxID=3133146 RepID=UPI0030ED9CD3
MKVIILLSSIFYILGLKLSHTIDVIKIKPRVERVTMQETAPVKTEKSIDFEGAKELTAKPDSVKCGDTGSEEVLQ